MAAVAAAPSDAVDALATLDPAAEAGGARRRRNQTDETQAVDELAQETQRTQLLDRVEQQLRGRSHVSRLLMVFGVADDRKIQSSISQEFNTWREKQERGETISGVLVFAAHNAVQLLEGPTEEIFKATEFFQSLSLEVPSVDKADPQRPSLPATVAAPRPALTGPMRVLHFTELHGVRTSTSWCSYVASGKMHGGQQIQLDEGSQPELVFSLYKKLLDVCLQVTKAAGENADADRLQSLYRGAVDGMPTADDLALFSGKVAAELFFSYAEFHKVFIAPFHLVLHSELLWPMPSALSY